MSLCALRDWRARRTHRPRSPAASPNVSDTSHASDIAATSITAGCASPDGTTAPARAVWWRQVGAGLRPDGWYARHVWLSATLALLLGSVGQLLVATTARGIDEASAVQRLAGTAYTASAWVLVALVLAMVTHPLHGTRIGRTLSVSLSALVIAGLSLVLVLGVALRVASGSWLTLGAIQFWLKAGDHILDSSAGDYRGWLALVLGVALVLGAISFVWLRRAVQRPTGRHVARPVHVLAAALLGGLVGGVFAARNEGFARGMFVGAPMLALVSSFDNPLEELDRVRAETAERGEALAPNGPPLHAAAAWREVALASDGPRPNVILMTLESVGVNHLGFAGYARDTTPELDRLAREGLWMRRAWATATHSNYAQMAILSSLFPRRSESLDMYERLDYPRYLFHDLFFDLGYTAATISSQDERWQGMIDFQRTGTPTFYWYAADYEGAHLDIGSEKIVPDEHTTDVILDWLPRQRGKRWSLYVNLQSTHFPYPLPPGTPEPFQPAEPSRATFRYLDYPETDREPAINRYDNALHYVDSQIGRIRRYLEASGELPHTLWIITADHGENFFDHGEVTHGKTLYDSEARVPLVLYYPDRIAPESRDDPVSHLDIMPTVAELLDIPPHPSYQGASFLEPGATAKRGIYMNIQGLRFADGVVCYPYKLVLERTGKRSLLFDLGRDPAEEHDLFSKEPALAGLLAESLSAQLGAQLDYHAEESPTRSERFQPRMRRCPALP